MSLARLFASVLLALTLVASIRADTTASAERFSKSLPAAEATDAGLTHLDPDQLAILDALVRQDVKSWDYVSKTPRADRFSARLSAVERHNAGLDLLSDAQLLRLDAAVERLMPVAPRGSYAASTPAAPASTPIRAVKINRAPEIHGSVSLMVAAGSGGYSAYGGAIEVNYTDPASGFAIAVAYSEVHSKGGYGYGRHGCFGGLYDDPFFTGYPRW